MSKGVFIGIDVGTSGVKTVAIDITGKMIGSHTEPLEMITPKPGWTEQNPDDWWLATKQSLKLVNKELSLQGEFEILSISLSGQMHSLVILDKNDIPIRNAILWNDGRTHEECIYITEKTGVELGKITGNPPLEGFTAPKILWVRNQEPSLFKKIHSILLPKDYIRFMLTGQKFTEPTDASGTLLYDINANKWSDSLCGKLDIDASLLPEIVKSDEIAGYLKSDVASEIGFKKDIPIVAGAADNACASLGAGVIESGSLMITVGTSGAVVAPCDTPLVDPKLRIHLMRHVLQNTWYQMGVVLSAGATLNWWDSVSGENGLETLLSQVSFNTNANDEILFLPYLTGERTPHANPKARGVFFGLHTGTTRGDLTRAVLQGVALALRDSLELMTNKNRFFDEAVIVGGGAKSSKWKKLISDTLQVPLKVTGPGEGAPLGASMLAASTSKDNFSDLEEVVNNWVHTLGTTEPDTDKSGYYSELHKRYQNLYDSIVSEFP